MATTDLNRRAALQLLVAGGPAALLAGSAGTPGSPQSSGPATNLANRGRGRGGGVDAVGAGHVHAMLGLRAAEGLQADGGRLRELRAEAPIPLGNSTATLSMDISGESPPPRGPP